MQPALAGIATNKIADALSIPNKAFIFRPLQRFCLTACAADRFKTQARNIPTTKSQDRCPLRMNLSARGSMQFGAWRAPAL
jgi:hypothetical protein